MTDVDSADVARRRASLPSRVSCAISGEHPEETHFGAHVLTVFVDSLLAIDVRWALRCGKSLRELPRAFKGAGRR